MQIFRAYFTLIPDIFAESARCGSFGASMLTKTSYIAISTRRVEQVVVLATASSSKRIAPVTTNGGGGESLSIRAGQSGQLRLLVRCVENIAGPSSAASLLTLAEVLDGGGVGSTATGRVVTHVVRARPGTLFLLNGCGSHRLLLLGEDLPQIVDGQGVDGAVGSGLIANNQLLEGHSFGVVVALTVLGLLPVNDLNLAAFLLLGSLDAGLDLVDGNASSARPTDDRLFLARCLCNTTSDLRGRCRFDLADTVHIEGTGDLRRRCRRSQPLLLVLLL